MANSNKPQSGWEAAMRILRENPNIAPIELSRQCQSRFGIKIMRSTAQDYKFKFKNGQKNVPVLTNVVENAPVLTNVAASVAGSTESLTIGVLKKVSTFAKEKGGAAKLREDLQHLTGIADEVGGMKNFQEILEALSS